MKQGRWGRQNVSSDFTDVGIGTAVVLVFASWLCPTYQYSYMTDNGFSLLADNQGNEKAPARWIPEPNRH